MSPRFRSSLPIGLLLTALTAQLLVHSSAGPAAAAASSLTVSPRNYVGGQLLTFEGNLGVNGERKIHLESRAVNRPGAKWVDVPGSWNRTNGDGSFSFKHPAPSMFNKSYRVAAGGGHATDGWLLKAKSQDLVVYADRRPVAGQAFDLIADTVPGPHRRPKDSPTFLYKRPDLPAPVFPGRELTLQKRVGQGWTTLATTRTDNQGVGRFRVTVDNPGEIVYRVRQEDYPQAGGPPIGWFPSYPTPVRVFGSARAAKEAPEPAPRVQSAPAEDSTSGAPLARSGGEANATAAQKFGWRPSQFDFAWVAGESLSTPPYRGQNPKGWWLDTGTGLGRAAKHNGGLALESSRDYAGSGDRGTTAVTMQDNPMKYGRWEVRVRVKSVEGNARDYRSRVELVPARAADYCRGKRNITVGEIRAHSGKMRFGAKSVKRHRKWSGTRRVGNVNNRAVALAVEVTRKHVSFFHNSKVIGTAPRAAVPNVPLTLRLSLVGKGQQEMNSTEAKYDWVRGFSLKRGKTVGGGSRLKSRRLRGGC